MRLLLAGKPSMIIMFCALLVICSKNLMPSGDFCSTRRPSRVPSGHSVQSAAAAVVLTDMFGEFTFTDYTHTAQGLQRSFTSFHQAAEKRL